LGAHCFNIIYLKKKLTIKIKIFLSLGDFFLYTDKSGNVLVLYNFENRINFS